MPHVQLLQWYNLHRKKQQQNRKTTKFSVLTIHDFRDLGRTERDRTLFTHRHREVRENERYLPTDTEKRERTNVIYPQTQRIDRENERYLPTDTEK